MLAAFLTGVVQVCLVVLQTRQIARRAPLAHIVLVAIAISAVWVFNVRAAVSGIAEGAAYALGAGAGTYIAMSLKMKEKA